MPQLSGNRLVIARTYLICMLGLLYLPTTVAAQSVQESTDSADKVVAGTADTTTATANIDSPTSVPDPNAAKGARVVKGYHDLLSPDKKISERAFKALYNQIFQLGEVSFDFLDDPEALISALSKTMLSDDKNIAAGSTYIIAQIGMAGGNRKWAEERGMAVQDYGLSEPYQHFDKFGVNDTLARLATEAEGDVQEYAVLAIFLQDVMSEKNDVLIIDTFRSANTDDDTLRRILFGLVGSVYDLPGSIGLKRPISSELARALYELLSHEELPVCRSASKVLAYSDSENARDVVIAGLIAGPNDEVFERSLRILKQHNGAELKQDPRLRDVVNSLEGESRKKAYSEFLESLE